MYMYDYLYISQQITTGVCVRRYNTTIYVAKHGEEEKHSYLSNEFNYFWISF
jgi:hypothetical protein